jgi:hypothetical protein
MRCQLANMRLPMKVKFPTSQSGKFDAQKLLILMSSSGAASDAAGFGHSGGLAGTLSCTRNIVRILTIVHQLQIGLPLPLVHDFYN